MPAGEMRVRCRVATAAEAAAKDRADRDKQKRADMEAKLEAPKGGKK